MNFGRDLEEVLKENLLNERFHSSQKDCVLVDSSVNKKYTETDKVHITYRQQYCQTHKRQVGPSGWEWGWYGGTKSLRYKKHV